MHEDQWSLDRALSWAYWRLADVTNSETLFSVGDLIFYPPGQTPEKKAVYLGDDRQVYAAFRSGAIVARGRRMGLGDRIYMTPADWMFLRFQTLPGRECRAVPNDAGETFWTNVVVERERFLRAFPENAAKTNAVAPMGRLIDDLALRYLATNKPTVQHGWQAAAVTSILAEMPVGTRRNTVEKYARPRLKEYAGKA